MKTPSPDETIPPITIDEVLDDLIPWIYEVDQALLEEVLLELGMAIDQVKGFYREMMRQPRAVTDSCRDQASR